MASNEAKIVRWFGIGTEASTANSFAFSGTFAAKNNGGTSAELAAPIIDTYDASPANAWSVDADVSGNDIRLLVNGEAATTIDWRIEYEVITEDNT